MNENCCCHVFKAAPTMFKVSSRLNLADYLGIIQVRLGIARDSYQVKPGLYAVGNPGNDSEVLVSANYKLSFDYLRRELKGRDLWILVLDTNGVNVWCSAGKGVFSSSAILDLIKQTKLPGLVNHRRLILPQLSAPGVCAHEVKRKTGFSVIYGPVRAFDLPRFLDNDLKADEKMRRVGFTLGQRLAVVPVELKIAGKYLVLFLALTALLLVIKGQLNPANLLAKALPVSGAFLCGSVLVPIVLPWIPFRSFVLKGWLLGFCWAIACALLFGFTFWNWLAGLLFLPVLTAVLALNYTGCSTFTSQNGVNREIKLFARPLGLAALAGFIFFVTGQIVHFF